MSWFTFRCNENANDTSYNRLKLYLPDGDIRHTIYEPSTLTFSAFKFMIISDYLDKCNRNKCENGSHMLQIKFSEGRFESKEEEWIKIMQDEEFDLAVRVCVDAKRLLKLKIQIVPV